MRRQHDWNLAVVLAAVAALASACDSGGPPASDEQTDVQRGTAEVAPPEPAEQSAAPAAERAVVAETLPYAEVGEQLVYGHFVFPSDMVDPLPGIIVIHERWGLDASTRDLADRLAGNGYVVLAVDLFGGKTASDSATSRALMLPVIENPEIANENIRQAYEFLAQSGQAPEIAVLGWSFGGNWALNAAMLFPDDLDAAVIYYGQVTNNEEKLAPVNVPILGLFGEKDRGVTMENVREFEKVLEKLGKDYEIETFPGVGHAFADPAAPNYDGAVAEQAWSRALDFLGRHLKTTADEAQ